MAFCRFCGSKAPDDAIFCGRCGQAIHATSEGQTNLKSTLNDFSSPPSASTANSGTQSVPSFAQEDERRRQVVAPILPFQEQAPAGSVPSVPNVPQVGSVPSMPGMPQAPLVGTAAKAGFGPAAKLILITIFCAAVIVGGLKVLPLITQAGHPTGGTSQAGSNAPHTPALDQLSVYVRSQDGSIYTLNASNGAQRWKYTADSKGTNKTQVVDGVVYYILDDDNAQSSTMYTLNAQTGALQRQYKLPYYTLETSSFIPNFTVMNGVIYFSALDMAFAINASNGTRLWQYQWFGRGASTPVVANGMVYYVTGTGVIYAFRGNDGTLLWKYDLGQDAVAQGSIMGSYPTPVIINDTLYVVGWLTDNMYAISLATHTVQWHTHLNGGQTEGLLAANGVLFIDTSYTSIYALQATDGSQLWRKDHFSSRLTDATTLYAFGLDANGSPTNDLYALNSSDGTIVWHKQLPGTYPTNVTTIDKIVYAMTDTTLIALHAQDGSLLWQASIAGGYIGV